MRTRRELVNLPRTINRVTEQRDRNLDELEKVAGKEVKEVNKVESRVRANITRRSNR